MLFLFPRLVCLPLFLCFVLSYSRAAEEGTPPALPALTMDDFGWVERELFLEIETALDQASPRAKPGDRLVFRSSAGQNIDAVYEYGEKSQFLVKQAGKDFVIKYVDLPPDTRIRVDISYRVRHVEMEAKTLTRQVLEKSGVTFRAVAANAPESEGKAAFLIAQPDMHARFGRQMLTAGGDPGTAGIHLRSAAHLADADGLFGYGLLLSRPGTVFFKPGEGLPFLAAAQARGVSDASEVLRKINVENDQQRAALERYHLQVAEKSEAIAKKVSELRAIKAQGRGSIAPREFQQTR